MKSKAPWWVVAAVLLCTVMGVLGGFSLGDLFGPAAIWPKTQAPETAVRQPIPATEAVLDGKVQVLILGVDALDIPAPRLESVWILTYIPGQTPYYLVGLPPFTQVSLPGRSPMRMTEAYRFDVQRGGAFSLLTQAMNSLLEGFMPEAIVQLDREAIRLLFDSRGGITLAERRLTGAEVLGTLDETLLDPIPNLHRQAEALQGLLDTYGSITFDGDIAPTLIAMEGHFRSTASIPDLVHPLLPAQGSDFYISPIKQNFVLSTLPDGSPAVILQD